MRYNISSSGVPILSKQDLEAIADRHTRSFTRLVGEDSPRFSVLRFANHFLKKHVQFEHLSNNACILGLSVFIDGTPIPIYRPEENSVKWCKLNADTILMDKSLHSPIGYNVQKCRFTLIHECAHHLLHVGYYQGLASRRSSRAIAYSIQKEHSRASLEDTPTPTWSDVDWIEWQANYMASALLMPRHRIELAINECDYYDTYKTKVMQKRFEPEAYKSFTRSIARFFRVSDTTAKIRLTNVGFERLEDRYEPPIDPYGPFVNPPNRKLTKREEENERILLEWENRFLNPDDPEP